MACATAIALLMICVSLPMVSSCPAECSCVGTNVYCEFRQFTSVPQNISANTTILLLRNNYITELDSGDFNELVNLRTLSIYRNKLATIPEGVFNELRQLEVLSLNDNEITALDSGAFNGLVSLQILYLFRNKLTSLPEGVFNDLRLLEDLRLENNDITTLNSGVFSGLVSLQTLGIFGNKLTTLPEGVFNGLRLLERLYLYDNNITLLDSGVFGGLVSLQTLSIYRNELTSLSEGVFSELRLLENLYLFDNNITAINPGVFNGLVNLQILYLERNKLTTLPGGVFDQLQSLEVLRLFDNDISSLDSGVFDELVSLRTLRIDGNNLTTLPEGALGEVTPGYSIAFTDNPWNCDCKLRWLQELLLSSTNVTFVDWRGVNYPTVCKTPSFHASELLVDIQPGHLVCPPEIQTDREEINLDVTSGMWVELVCPVIGDPIPFITWRVSYGAGNSSQMNISSPDMTHSNGSLTIGTVMESDSGTYTCTSSNSAGSDQLLYHVNVIQDHKQATDTPKPKTSNLTLPISLGVLGLFLIIIATLIFIVIKQRGQLRKQDGNTVGNTDGNQGYDDFITSQPEVQLNIVDKNEAENDHYNTIDEDGARIDAQPGDIHAEINSNSQSESGAVYETRIHNDGQF